MKILVVGSGGREHALAWALGKESQVDQVYVAPGNAGMTEVAQCVDLAVDDLEGLEAFARQEGIDLTVVGPELPLTMGIVDRFQAAGLACFGPTKAAARLEGSKAFSKEMMKKYGIPTADFDTFQEVEPALAFIDRIGLPCVVKADGLAAGKGVLICETWEEAEKAVRDMLEGDAFGSAGQKILIEAFLQGEEVSVLALADGDRVCVMESARDHKRIYDGDKGPNTGGMGAYSPAEADLYGPDLEAEVLETILLPTLAGMKAEGCPFVGVLYTGLMLTAQGPKVLEYNVRFGDPETQPLMARLESGLLEAMTKALAGDLRDDPLVWKQGAALTVVLASKGYPDQPEKGQIIEGADRDFGPEVHVFHSGTKEVQGQLVTSGGRVLGVTAVGDDIAQARQRAYAACEAITFPGMQFRRDIGGRHEEGQG